MVPLEDLATPELVCPAVAEALDLHGADRPWQVEALADHIAHRDALLVLDNCEHLLSAVSDLVEGLRAACPHVRFLLTSRRPLRLSGEDVVVVPPLDLPDEAPGATPEVISHYEAVRLFVDRATSARSDFELTPDNAPAVAVLCRDLQGVPLAIELAAARVRVLSPQEISESLTARLDVLTMGFRDAGARHQSLRACVDWSFHLCSDIEQRLWARSSVFIGGRDLGSVAAVCAADDLPADAILDVMSALVDQSVVVAETDDAGHTRYRMLIRHPAVRSRAGREGRRAAWSAGAARDAGARTWSRVSTTLPPGRTSASGSDDSVSTRRTCGRPSSTSPGRRTAPRPVWTWPRSSTSTGPPRGCSTRAATPWSWRWPPAPVRRSSDPSRWPWPPGSRSSRTTDSGRGSWSTRATRSPRPSTTPVLSGCCSCRPRCSRCGTAARTWPRTRPTGRWRCCGQTGHLSGELLALFVAGVCHGFAGNSVEATARHQECIARADEVGERHMKALAVAGLGEQALAAGRLDEATVQFRAAIALKRELGDRMGVAVGLDSLGRVANAQGLGERAALLLGAAEAIWEGVGMSETGNPFAFTPSRSDGLEQTRRLLGKERFRELLRRGAQLSLDDAVRFAIDDTTDAAPPPAPAEPSPLTRRELEVADLVAEGLSNPEIAARLVISVRTAQGHVENILRKLGFNSRSLIAAWVTERRLAERRSR